MTRPAPPFNGSLTPDAFTMRWKDTGRLAECSLDIANTKVVHHPAGQCEGPCPIHSPGEHHMVTWPLVWQHDFNEFWRICPHGDRHPDPDVMLFNEEPLPEYEDCYCGCCKPPKRGRYAAD